VTPRVVSITSNTVTINADTTDQYNAQVVGGFITVNAPTGTPTDGQKLILRVLDSGTSGTFLWNAIWRVVGTVLPFATSVNKVTYVGAVYNASAVKWDVIGVVTQS
jgi:hypothetical protein